MPGTNFITSADEGTWFSFRASTIGEDGKAVFEEPKPGAGRVCLRDIRQRLKDKMLSRKTVHEIVYNPGTNSMERIGYPEDVTPAQVEQESGDLWDYAITGLEGFSIGGVEVPCTREGKLKLMAIPAFDRFIGQCLKDLRAAEEQVQEAQEGN